MSPQSAIVARFEEVRRVLQTVGAPDVQICAVTKTQTAQIVNSIYDHGLHLLAENRVQELLQKLPALNPGFSVDLIGQLQTNKVKYIVDVVRRVQSLDRLNLAQALSARAQSASHVMPCLVQVNIAREPQKAGLPEESLDGFLQSVALLPGLRVEGLMAIMPQTDDPSSLRPYFRRMRRHFERLRREAPPGVDMNCLSMGMSGDYRIAAEEGSTLLRLGSALFGHRN